MKKFLITLLLSPLTAFAAGSYALYDYDRDEFQVESNVREQRPIASITKLFTAVMIDRSGVDLDEKVKVGGHSGGKVPRGTMMTRLDLMRAMLISSDNRAAETLAETYPGGFNRFIKDVNEYTQYMGLLNTRIVDSSGLLPGNVSTAQDLVKFLWKISENPVIRDIASERYATLNVPGKTVKVKSKSKKKKSYARTLRINLHNTNPSMFVFDNILISKTGFTNPAKRCVVMLVEKNQQKYGIAILGQPDVRARSKIAQELITATPLPKKPEPKEVPVLEYNFQYY
jgi:serine-type D-Ala-D-Ala endopeptidase (penicillin-binding protein 7)